MVASGSLGVPQLAVAKRCPLLADPAIASSGLGGVCVRVWEGEGAVFVANACNRK